MIVSSSVPSNLPVYFSLVTRTLTVVLSATLVAVISAGFSVHVPSAFWYSILTPSRFVSAFLADAVAVPAAYAFPSYTFVTSVGVSMIKSSIFCSSQFAVIVTLLLGIWKLAPLLIEETPSNPLTVHPVNLYPLRVGSDLTTTFSRSSIFLTLPLPPYFLSLYGQCY